MIKKFLAALLAASLVLVLAAGCSSREDESSEEESESTSQSQKSPEDMTEDEALDNNAQIPDEAVNLVQFDEVQEGDTIVLMKTSLGDIRIKLFPEYAPKTVENFTKLASDGYYNGVTFHRVIQGFMVQSGDPTGTGAGGESIYSTGEGDPGEFEDEFSLALWNFRGALSMANRGKDTNTSQFFIVQCDELDDDYIKSLRQNQFPEKVVNKYAEVGGTPHLDMVHTVFGMVIEGMDVVDEIAGVQTGEGDVPVEPVLIESVTVESGAVASDGDAADGEDASDDESAE